MRAVLFDIDGTLLQSAEVDDALYRKAVHDVLGPVVLRPSLHDYDFVTDSGILTQILADNRIPADPDPTDDIKSHFVNGLREFVARAAHHLVVLQTAMEPGLALETVRQGIEAQLRAFFHTEGQTVPPDAVEVTAVDDSGVEGQDLLAIRLKAPRYVLDRPVSLVLGLPVPRGG